MDDTMLKKFDRIAIYAVIYTSIFILLCITMPYILPFVLGTLIALMAQPLIKFITNKFKVKRSWVGLIIVLIIFAVIIGIVTIIIVTITNELVSLLNVLPSLIVTLTEKGYELLDRLTAYSNSLDPEIISSIKGSSSKLLSGSLSVAVYIVNMALNIVKSLPDIIMLILFTIISAIYVAIDFPKLKEKFFSLFSKESGSKARSIVFEANKMISSYFKAYGILISITFVQTFIGYSILKMNYAAILSLITAISDLLPVLGPGTVIIPMSIGFLISGNYIKGIGLLVLYLIVTAVRQVLEPRVVSANLGLSPLSILFAIYVGLKVYGILGMLFTVFFVIFYSVLKKVKVL